MAFLKRISLFLLTNLLVMVTIGVIWSLISAYFLPSLNSHIATLMLFSLVLGMTGSFVSLLLSRWMAKTMHGVQVIDPNTAQPEMRWLVSKVHEYARQAQLPAMPEVGIYESDDVNAFATGPSKSRSLVAVSTGLLRRMSREEAEGVLGHEVAHIANGDMVTMTLIQGIVNTFAFFFSRLLASVIASNVEERNRPLVQMLVTIVGDIAFTMLGSIVVAWFSRRREFRADRGGAQYAGRQNMINALRRLQSVYERPEAEEGGRDALAALKISHREPGGLMALFMTHPPLEVRIEALQQMRMSAPV
ncbi:MAG: protease HtpX [Bdellovibrionaceae bacterium]|nr:protease HtpX [Pseudobdellovibrionaceae bacterium]